MLTCVGYLSLLWHDPRGGVSLLHLLMVVNKQLVQLHLLRQVSKGSDVVLCVTAVLARPAAWQLV